MLYFDLDMEFRKRQWRFYAAIGQCFILCCTPKPMRKGDIDPQMQWHALRAACSPRPCFKGNGKITAQNPAGQKATLGFGSASLGDSLWRVDIHSPAGGNWLTLKTRYNRYQLKAPSQGLFLEGTYSDTLFRPWLHLDMPLFVLKGLFGAQPFVLQSSLDSVTTFRKTTRYHCTLDSVTTFQLDIGTNHNHPCKLIWYRHHREDFRIQWKRYRNDTPHWIKVTSSLGAMVIFQFKEVYNRERVPESLFRFGQSPPAD